MKWSFKVNLALGTHFCHLSPMGICLMCQGPNAIPLSRKSNENGLQLFSINFTPHPHSTSFPPALHVFQSFSNLSCFFSMAVLPFGECGSITFSPNARKPNDLVLVGQKGYRHTPFHSATAAVSFLLAIVKQHSYLQAFHSCCSFCSSGVEHLVIICQ